jgi:hypothetical protein
VTDELDFSTINFGPLDGLEWKWGLNRDGQLEIWEVGGPGDGFPSHGDQLEQAWGRPHDIFNGDIVGNAIITEQTVTITAYFTPEVPAAVISWAQTRFPGHTIALQAAGQA